MSLAKKIYICLFAVLYLSVAFTSTLHAVEFFGLANAPWLATILAIAFELGQAAVLFELLTSNKDRKKVMPWVLMAIFTLVQVLGNVYSSYKYIILNSPENLHYFKEPIFIWTELPDAQANVIVTYIVGAVLPICALLLTSMITNQLELGNDKKDQTNNKDKEPLKIEEVKQEISEPVVEQPVKEVVKIQEPITIIEKPIDNEVVETSTESVLLEEDLKEEIDEPIPQEIEELFQQNEKKSRFINL
jgi:hypothetical protein